MDHAPPARVTWHGDAGASPVTWRGGVFPLPRHVPPGLANAARRAVSRDMGSAKMAQAGKEQEALQLLAEADRKLRGSRSFLAGLFGCEPGPMGA